jgi:hypothetical protein
MHKTCEVREEQWRRVEVSRVQRENSRAQRQG